MLQKKTVEPGTFSLLEKFAKADALKGFALVGGTALSLQLGHRISTGLDFFSQTDFDTKRIKDFLEVNDSRLVYARIGKNLVQATTCGVKVDFASHKYPVIKEGISFHKIYIFSIEDIAAMKLGAILSRGKKRDFIDVARLMDSLGLVNMLRFFQEKYNQQSIFHVIKGLGYFADAEQDTEPLKIIDPAYNWENAKKIISKGIRGLGR